METTSLTVDFAGQIHEVDTVLTFGRAGDLAVDEANRFLHRICGEFVQRNNVWWLINRGRKTPLVVFASDSRVELRPAGSTALTTEAGAVSFVAGPTPYTITYRHGLVPEIESHIAEDGAHVTGTVTAAYGALLTKREREFLATFARPRLEGARRATPSFKDVASVWGVAEKTVDNTVQAVRRKLRHNGISNIDSMEKLLSHLLAHGQIAVSDLYQIDYALDPAAAPTVAPAEAGVAEEATEAASS